MIGKSQVHVKWLLVSVAITALTISSISAVAPLGQQMQALAVTIAGDVICSQCVGVNGDGTNDIKDGSVTNSKIASSAVTNSKIASSAVTNSKIGSNAVTSSKIAAGGVANSDIASNAVTADKVADGTIGYADVSRTLIAVEHRDDCNCGGTGWDPDGTASTEIIYDARITKYSQVSVSTLFPDGLMCTTMVNNGYAYVLCNSNIYQGAGINYAIFNNPAFS